MKCQIYVASQGAMAILRTCVWKNRCIWSAIQQNPSNIINNLGTKTDPCIEVVSICPLISCDMVSANQKPVPNDMYVHIEMTTVTFLAGH